MAKTPAKRAKKAPAKKQEGTVAEASMSAGQSSALGGAVVTSNAIEQAMHLATMNALADGVTDPDEILKLKLAARDRVKADARAAAEAAAKAAE